MLTLRTSDTWSTDAEYVASKVKEVDSLSLVVSSDRPRAFDLVSRSVVDAVPVTVPCGLDQVEHTVLTLASALGCAREADEGLRTHPEQMTPLLSMFKERLAGRPIVVNGWDTLGWGLWAGDLDASLAPRAAELRSWLGEQHGVFLCDRKPPPGIHTERNCFTGAAVSLWNGAQRDPPAFERTDPEQFSLVLAAMAIGEDDPEALLWLPPDALRDRIVRRLPRSAVDVLRWLGVHGRPLEPALLPSRPSDEEVRLGVDLGLWFDTSEGLALATGWANWIYQVLSHEQRHRAHGQLAESHTRAVNPADPSAAMRGVAVLGAHRHLVASGDIPRARLYARYGATLLIDEARRRSIGRDFVGAAQLYGEIVDAHDRKQWPVLPHLAAYARHYLHFNRFRAQLESREATIAGYRRAVDGWPENALFWSRLVRVELYAGHQAAAHQDLATGRALVPEHPFKEQVLTARTVAGLLRNGDEHLVDAVRVWGTFIPNHAYERDVARTLEQKLRAGWEVDRLIIHPDRPLVLTRSTKVRVVAGGAGWSAQLLAHSFFAEGASPLDALAALVDKVRDEAGRLLASYTPDLSANDRLQKRVLLAAVDVVASRVDGEAPSAWWFMGTVYREADGSCWFRTVGARELRFKVDPAVAAELTIDELPHLARVDANELGVPEGPVVEIEPGFTGSDGALWRAWRERTHLGA
jgi:hypothetical protein